MNGKASLVGEVDYEMLVNNKRPFYDFQVHGCGELCVYAYRKKMINVLTSKWMKLDKSYSRVLGSTLETFNKLKMISK